MTDQELLISTLREAADEVIAQLIAVLDTQQLASAIEWLDEGSGLRVVK